MKFVQKPGLLAFCAHCFCQVYDAVAHFNETGHANFLHDGEPVTVSPEETKPEETKSE